LVEKYKIREHEAQAFADFLIPCLIWDPDKRASAETMLDHPWLKMEAKYETRMSPEEFEEVINKSKSTMQSEISKGAYVPGDAQTEYY
jgi:serine/threonine-protein kinase SRPK3